MQLALVAAQAAEKGGVGGLSIYIHTKPPFPIRCLQQLVAIHNNNNNDEVDERVMQNIVVKNACDPNELPDLLIEIHGIIKANENSRALVRLLVIDSICSLFFNRYPNTYEGKEERKMLLKAVSFGLKDMANKNNIAVVACNSVINSYNRYHPSNFVTSGRIVKPKITWIFESFVECRWLITKRQQIDGSLVRKIEIRYRDRPTTMCLFAIGNGGLSSVEKEGHSNKPNEPIP